MNRSIVLHLAAGAALLCAALPAAADDGAAPGADTDVSVLVRTVPVTSGSLPRVVTAFGTAQPDLGAHLAVMAPVAATVAEVYVRAGERVAKNQPLVRLAPTPTTAAAYAAAVSSERVARDSLARTKQMLAQRLATEPQVAAAEKADSDARAALAALNAQGANGPTIVRAPDAAVVTAVAAVTRAIVAEGAPLVELARPSGLVVVAGVTPGEAQGIKAGDAARVLPIGATAAVAGRVALAGAAVDPTTGLVPVDIAVPAGALLAGESAQATISTRQVSGFVVPHAAVLVNDGGATYVVQVEGGAAKTVPVRVLVAGGERDVVDGKLDRRAPLVLTGAYQLQDGMKVRYGDEAPRAAQ